MGHEVSTFCRVCEPSCGLVARVEEGEIVSLAPDKEHPVTRGFACHKGIAGLAIHRDPDRLAAPQRRVEGGFEACGWDEALPEIGGRLKALADEHGPDSVAFYLGNPLAFNALAGPAIGSFISQLGSRRVFGSGTQDCSNKFAAAEAVFGSSTIHPIPDIDHTDHLLCFGSNPRVSHMSFLSIADPVAHLRAAVKRGATVRHINPRRIEEEAAGLGEVVLIQPDTDLYLMAAMIHEIATAGLMDGDVLAAHGKHVEELLAFASRYPAERAAGLTGIDADSIRRMAREFAEAPSASVYMSTGVNMGRQGTLCYWLLAMLSAVTGNLDRRGGNLYAEGFYPAAKAGRTDPERSFFDSEFGRIRRIRGALPGNLMPDMILEGESRIRALVVVAGNPMLSVGGEERMREALEDLDLLVTVDLYRNATGEVADFVLPAADMFERRDLNLCGLGMQHQPFVQYTEAVVPPRDERREEWWIFSRLAQEIGFDSALDAGDDPPVFSRMDHMLAHSGLSIERLKRQPQGTAVLPGPLPGKFFDVWIQTRDKKVDCCPPLFTDALARAEEIAEELEKRPSEFKLISLRDTHMHNSWYHNVEKLKGTRHQENALHMHPDDAKERALDAGDRVRVASASGEIEARILHDSTLLRGVVAMTHGWGNQETSGMRVAQRHPGVNANRLLPSGPESFEPLSNQAFMTGIPVSIDPT